MKYCRANAKCFTCKHIIHFASAEPNSHHGHVCHFTSVHKLLSLFNNDRRCDDKICKRCSFECDMGNYSTRSMNKVWAFRRAPYSLNMCCIFTYRTRNEQRLYFLTRSSHTYTRLPYIVLILQLEYDMGWYRYTSRSENHSKECEKICKRCSSECDIGKYSTRSMNKVWAFRRTPYSLNMCCIFTYRTKNEQRLYFLTRSSRTYTRLPYIVLIL